MKAFIDKTLEKLESLVQEGRYEALETETVEIKPVPSDGGQWTEIHKSVNAFLNTRGGIIILGIKEAGQGPNRHYEFTGYREEAEAKLKELPKQFTDRRGVELDLRQDAFPDMQVRDFLDGRLALIFVDELPADRKYVFYKNEAYRRILTGDHKLKGADIEAQEAYQQEIELAREMLPWPNTCVDDLNLDALNDYIQHLNHPIKVETMKADMESAQPFLERKSFIKEGQATLLGMLVCGMHPGDHLGFRCHVHGYVDVPETIAQDKQDLIGNILPLMESSLSYILRNIRIGISSAGGGTSTPQYPEEVLRETVNNALAHRDYSINKQAIITIRPGEYLSIRNPGAFRRHLLIEHLTQGDTLRRVIPEAKARNPKLADVLRVYRKWEGKGIGMSTLVSLCLEGRIDIPAYRLYSEEVCLFLRPGRLIDDRIETRFRAYDAYIERKTRGRALSEEERAVLAYLMKAEWENEQLRYTILLTPDNNHFTALLWLEQCHLIEKHPISTAIYPIYIADRTLMRSEFHQELEELFGEGLRGLDATLRDILGLMYRHREYSRIKAVTAKMAAFYLWNEGKPDARDIKGFDTYYRKLRNAFNKLEKAGFIIKPTVGRGFVLNTDYLSERLI
ncbi:MAG: putative DNA binding domain-containing protein [Gallionellaceae bacterium]|nr:putative DNA binding domain-containing protein [Gallionellaceae bacterium]